MSYQVGSGYSFGTGFTQLDFDRFASLSQDTNPIHVDPVYAAKTKFGRTVAHGMLLYSTICRCLSEQFPSYLILSQKLKFPNPTFTGQDLSVHQEITKKYEQVGLLEVASQVVHPGGESGCDSQTSLSTTPDINIFRTLVDKPPAHKDSAIKSFKGFHLGQASTHERIFNRGDINEYIDLSGDRNHLHNSYNDARANGFNDIVIPGPLICGLFSYILGTKLPGPGTNWLKLSLEFFSPLYPEEQILARVQISQLRPEKELVNFALTAEDAKGTIICRGEALVLIKDVSSPD